jgi:hypothetical protein
MTKFVTSTILGAALVLGAAAGAYAADPQAATQAPYSAAGFAPKASGGANTPSTHFQKPAGYDQNPDNFPYTRKGVLKAN